MGSTLGSWDPSKNERLVKRMSCDDDGKIGQAEVPLGFLGGAAHMLPLFSLLDISWSNGTAGWKQCQTAILIRVSIASSRSSSLCLSCFSPLPILCLTQTLLILLYLSLCASQSVTLSRPCLPREVDQWFSQIAAKAQRGDKKRRRTRLIEVGVKLNQWHELVCMNVWFSAAIISCHPLAYL